MADNTLLHDGFLRSASLFPERPVLVCEDKATSYAELETYARSIAAVLHDRIPVTEFSLTAVLSSKTPPVYAGILGILMSGRAFLPVNKDDPAERICYILHTARCNAIICDSKSIISIDKIASHIDTPLYFILPECRNADELRIRWPRHIFVDANDFPSDGKVNPDRKDPENMCYVFFTSGSTGKPKGVMINHRNAVSFIRKYITFSGLSEHDRFSHFFDITWDPSLYDTFVPWECGGCTYIPEPREITNPVRYIQKNALTYVALIPSIAILMKRSGVLKNNAFPSIRYTHIGAEPLSLQLAEAWQNAAPNSIIENGYGPTEMTTAAIMNIWTRETPSTEYLHDIVPIGTFLPGIQGLIVDDHLREVPPGTPGELLLTGDQLTLGYLNNPEKTAASYIIPPGHTRKYYRTGDYVLKNPQTGKIHFLERQDYQVKIFGYRIELGEIESVIREEGHVDRAVVIGWPKSETGYRGTVAFISHPQIDVAGLKEKISARLPRHMIPMKIINLPEFPRINTGKIDRKALYEYMENL
jgi:amino acid adenylation domain-containing protein